MNDTWTPICAVDDLIADRGVGALIDGSPVAVFLLSGTGDVCAIDNVDPYSGASVLSRGLVGSAEIDSEWVPYVASPLRKQRFDLRTGRCLDDPMVSVDAYPVRVADGVIEVSRSGGSSWRNDHETGS